MTIVGRDSAQWVVQPALAFDYLEAATPTLEEGSESSAQRVVEPAIGNDTILE
jgi:hypothetical protein